MHVTKRGLALLSVALSLPVLAAPAARAETLVTEYAVSVRGFPVGRAELQASFADGRYSIRFSGGISGLARLFSDAKTTATVSGAVGEDRLKPAEYKHLWTEDDETETVEMRFSDGGLSDFVLDPPRRHPERYVPITDAAKAGALDPVSAFLWPAPQGVTGDICSRTLPLLDGRRRFDIRLKFSRYESFATRDKSFQHRAAVCSFRYERVAGHRIDGKSRDTITNGDGMEVWMAPAGDGLAAPARIQLATRIGRIVLLATKIELR